MIEEPPEPKMASVPRDKLPVIRLNYTRRPQGFARFSLDEQSELKPDVCSCCGSMTDWKRTEHDIVGGKYLAYVVYFCRACGWWNSFKYWEDRSGETIYRVDRNEPHLEEFDLGSRAAELDIVLRAVRRNYVDLRHLHWKVFEQAVKVMLSEFGFKVVDVSTQWGSAADLIAIGVDGTKIAVEIKHYNFRPVSLAVVQRLRGALQTMEPERGLIVTSSSFSRDALEAMEILSFRRGETTHHVIPVSGVAFSDIVGWLHLREDRPPDEVFELLQTFHLHDALSEQ